MLKQLLAIRAQRDDPTRDWWLAQSEHRTHKNERLDFARHAYLAAILQDTSPDIRIRKSTQCGISECEIVHAMALVDQGRSVFMVWPDERVRNLQVKERIDPTLNASSYYRKLLDEARRRTRKGAASDEVAIKQIGSAAIFMVGSNSLSAMKSVAADDLIIDEIDLCDERNIAYAPDRLVHSEHQTQWRVGNPTISGYGIDALYKESDRKAWHIPCPHCGKRQTVGWFTHVVRETDEGKYELRSESPAIICTGCDKAMDRLAVGEWVAAYPDRDASGYHISQLFSGSVPIDKLWSDFQESLKDETKRQRFYNSVLGLPFETAGSRLSESAILRACGDHPRRASAHGCYMGVDVGTLLHVVVLDGADRVIQIATVTEFEQLDDFMTSYGVSNCVVDMLPETRKAREFAQRYKGQVYLCQFVKSDDIPDFRISPEDMKVRADRTQTMDESHGAIASGVCRLPRDAASVDGFSAQMSAPSRVFDAQRQRFVWTEGNEPDHYRFAFNYAWLARNIEQRAGCAVVLGIGRGVA